MVHAQQQLMYHMHVYFIILRRGVVGESGGGEGGRKVTRALSEISYKDKKSFMISLTNTNRLAKAKLVSMEIFHCGNGHGLIINKKMV